MGNAHGFQQFVVLVHEDYPCLFDVEVLHLRMQVVVDGRCRTQLQAILGSLHGAALAQLAGSEDGDGLGFADAIVLAELTDGQFAQRVQVVVTVFQHALHQFHGCLFG